MLAFWQTAVKNRDLILQSLGRHLMICAAALCLGVLVAVPAGIALSRRPRAAARILAVFSVINTIPSIVLLGLAMILFGLGFAPSVAVLFLYSLLPILRGTYAGLTGVDPKYVKAATGMGMNPRQLLQHVRLPLALPALLTGIRLSAIYVISWATLAAFIGGGGLGDVIWMGLQSYNFPLVFCGTIPAIVLALLASALFNRLIRLAQKHVREEVRR